MNNHTLYSTLFRLFSLADENDIRELVVTMGGWLAGKGKISLDELDNVISALKKD